MKWKECEAKIIPLDHAPEIGDNSDIFDRKIIYTFVYFSKETAEVVLIKCKVYLIYSISREKGFK